MLLPKIIAEQSEAHLPYYNQSSLTYPRSLPPSPRPRGPPSLILWWPYLVNLEKKLTEEEAHPRYDDNDDDHSRLTPYNHSQKSQIHSFLTRI